VYAVYHAREAVWGGMAGGSGYWCVAPLFLGDTRCKYNAIMLMRRFQACVDICTREWYVML
jgi:hypothetical protein